MIWFFCFLDCILNHCGKSVRLTRLLVGVHCWFLFMAKEKYYGSFHERDTKREMSYLLDYMFWCQC